ncbi:hypothetical protein PAXRUDRAFT_19074 [Paxillus rubicundulus Ve08.2h10]|uniref:Uncharacterized protein n=1 Tax=Paxillus rubicundulus Ve08.2h10 TaxID=930991 RepID=A0A0D0D5L1_9AGAM|nr:hypothetical protein PAXRUDRAFT_19074 [Paxillus rubicundulus Ve08.2h10]
MSQFASALFSLSMDKHGCRLASVIYKRLGQGTGKGYEHLGHRHSAARAPGFRVIRASHFIRTIA